MQGVLKRTALLKHVWHEVLPYQEQPLTAPITPAQLSSDVLTQLASLLHQYSLQDSPQGTNAPDHPFGMQHSDPSLSVCPNFLQGSNLPAKPPCHVNSVQY